MSDEERAEVKKIFLQIFPAIISFGAASLLLKFYGD